MSPAESAQEIILYLEQQGWLSPETEEDRSAAHPGTSMATGLPAHPSAQGR
jgi:hypothetical protein